MFGAQDWRFAFRPSCLAPGTAIATFTRSLYPIIDVVLGGTGNEPMHIRDLTEIEEQILESVIRLMLLDIHATARMYSEL